MLDCEIKNIINEHLNELSSELNEINLNNNFWKWFGKSKVVDANNNPMICYHGTVKGGFSEFKPKMGYKGKSKQQLDLGSHFSKDKDYAQNYAGNKKTSKLYECFLRIENPLYLNEMFYKEDDDVTFLKMLNFMEKVLKIKINGDYFYNKNGEKQEQPEQLMINSFMIDKIPSNKLFNSLIDYGFDGVFHKPYNRNMHYINFHPSAYVILQPNQVKSVYNNGSWDISNNNIYG